MRLYRQQDQRTTAEREEQIGMLLFRDGAMDAETIAQRIGLGLERVRVILHALERQNVVRVQIESLQQMEARIAQLPVRAFVRVRRHRRLVYCTIAQRQAAAFRSAEGMT